MFSVIVCDELSCGKPSVFTGDVPYKHCSACKMLYYCSEECQKKNWSEHKRDCQYRAGTFGKEKQSYYSWLYDCVKTLPKNSEEENMFYLIQPIPGGTGGGIPMPMQYKEFMKIHKCGPINKVAELIDNEIKKNKLSKFNVYQSRAMYIVTKK